MPRSASDVWLLLLAIFASCLLWLQAHRAANESQGFDIPISFQEIPETLVMTSRNADVVNIQVLGTRADLRELSRTPLEYAIDVSGARPGPALYEVETTRIDGQLPRRAQITSRSPSAIEVTFERRGRKSVEIRPDVVGEPAEGFVVTQVAVEPPRVWLVGARSSVLRLSEVVTETVDLEGLDETLEREVRLSLGAGHVWMEESQPVTIRIQVEPLVPPEGRGREGGAQEQVS